MRMFIYAAVAVLLAACGVGPTGNRGPTEAPVEPRESDSRQVGLIVSDFVDLTRPGVGYLFDTRAPSYEPRAVDLVCPNNVQMTLDDWRDMVAAEFGEDPTASATGQFVLTGDPAFPFSLSPVSVRLGCHWDCKDCPDGAVICVTSEECDDREQWDSWAAVSPDQTGSTPPGGAAPSVAPPPEVQPGGQDDGPGSTPGGTPTDSGGGGTSESGTSGGSSGSGNSTPSDTW